MIKMNDYEWMTEDQRECYRMLCVLYDGPHHLPYKKVKPCGEGIAISVNAGIATYDFDLLTRAVFMAHDRCIRLEIGSSGPGLIKLIFHRRHRRTGPGWNRHPDLDEAVKAWKDGKK
jgi:hypothetical protein